MYKDNVLAVVQFAPLEFGIGYGGWIHQEIPLAEPVPFTMAGRSRGEQRAVRAMGETEGLDFKKRAAAEDNGATV